MSSSTSISLNKWPISDPDNDSDLILAVTSVLHEDAEAQMPQWKGSLPGRAKNLGHNREARHVQLYNDYSQQRQCCTRTYFGPLLDFKEVVWYYH
jgi:hypothetical protein